MKKINSLYDIEEIKIHWSESKFINDVLDPLGEGGGDIEIEVDIFAFNLIIERAAKKVGCGYDKTSLSVKLKDGLQWCDECKFYLTSEKVDLLGLLNSGR